MASSEAAASRIADALKAQIAAGELAPGMRLSQERVREVHGVSRSTLREAFQQLVRERLLVHELSRGVFVRQLSRVDVADLYEVRRIIECAALRHIKSLSPAGLQRLASAINDGQEAVREERWGAAAAANNRFHEALVALAGSERLNVIMSGVLAEYRLAYADMSDTHLLLKRFIGRNVEIAEALRSGDLDGAANLLNTYLLESEEAFRGDGVD